MKNILLLTTLCFLALTAKSQMQIELNLQYDEDIQSYKVIAKPNFSMKNFLWGPSQISLIFPQKMADEALEIVSQNAGSWSENSHLFNPKAQADCDFHGIGTGGAKVQLVEGQETELFQFKLKEGRVEGLRLFEHGLDAESYEEGMKGSDFRHSITAHNGEELYAGNYELPGEQLLTEESSAVEVFPNPSDGVFQLRLKGVDSQSSALLKYYTASGVLVHKELQKVSEINKEKRVLPSSVSDQNLFLRIVTDEGQSFVKKLSLQK